MNTMEKIKTNKVLTARIKEMMKEVREKNYTIEELTAEKNVLIYQIKALKDKFEEINGVSWDKI